MAKQKVVEEDNKAVSTQNSEEVRREAKIGNFKGTRFFQNPQASATKDSGLGKRTERDFSQSNTFNTDSQGTVNAAKTSAEKR